jgi:hypothetical protein
VLDTAKPSVEREEACIRKSAFEPAPSIQPDPPCKRIEPLKEVKEKSVAAVPAHVVVGLGYSGTVKARSKSGPASVAPAPAVKRSQSAIVDLSDSTMEAAHDIVQAVQQRQARRSSARASAGSKRRPMQRLFVYPHPDALDAWAAHAPDLSAALLHAIKAAKLRAETEYATVIAAAAQATGGASSDGEDSDILEIIEVPRQRALRSSSKARIASRRTRSEPTDPPSPPQHAADSPSPMRAPSDSDASLPGKCSSGEVSCAGSARDSSVSAALSAPVPSEYEVIQSADSTLAASAALSTPVPDDSEVAKSATSMLAASVALSAPVPGEFDLTQSATSLPAASEALSAPVPGECDLTQSADSLPAASEALSAPVPGECDLTQSADSSSACTRLGGVGPASDNCAAPSHLSVVSGALSAVEATGDPAGSRLTTAASEPVKAKRLQHSTIAVTTDDEACMAEGEFLNDSCVDWFMRFTHLRALSSEAARRSVHIFGSFMYKKLMLAKRSENGNMRKAFAAVRRWTAGIDIFKSEFVLIPVCISLHWSLAIVCHLPALASALQKEHNARVLSANAALPDVVDLVDTSPHQDVEKSPVILLLDSLSYHSAADICKDVRAYLLHEWEDKHNGGLPLGCVPASPTHIASASSSRSPESSESPSAAGGVQRPEFELSKGLLPNPKANVPKQDNSCDCGVFILKYAWKWCELIDGALNEGAPLCITQADLRTLPRKFVSPEWFDKNDVVVLRQLLKALMAALRQPGGDLELLVGLSLPNCAKDVSVLNRPANDQAFALFMDLSLKVQKVAASSPPARVTRSSVNSVAGSGSTAAASAAQVNKRSSTSIWSTTPTQPAAASVRGAQQPAFMSLKAPPQRVPRKEIPVIDDDDEASMSFPFVSATSDTSAAAASRKLSGGDVKTTAEVAAILSKKRSGVGVTADKVEFPGGPARPSPTVSSSGQPMGMQRPLLGPAASAFCADRPLGHAQPGAPLLATGAPIRRPTVRPTYASITMDAHSAPVEDSGVGAFIDSGVNKRKRAH